jgi:hypothetical protein
MLIWAVRAAPRLPQIILQLLGTSTSRHQLPSTRNCRHSFPFPQAAIGHGSLSCPRSIVELLASPRPSRVSQPATLICAGASSARGRPHGCGLHCCALQHRGRACSFVGAHHPELLPELQACPRAGMRSWGVRWPRCSLSMVTNPTQVTSRTGRLPAVCCKPGARSETAARAPPRLRLPHQPPAVCARVCVDRRQCEEGGPP